MDKKAMAMAVGLTVISWAAIPLLYYLLRKKHTEKEEEDVLDGMKKYALGPVYDEVEWEKANGKNRQEKVSSRKTNSVKAC